jgi:molybdopterin converting factor small subunit
MRRKHMNKITVNIRLFGAFRKYGEVAVLEAPAGVGINELKELLSNWIGGMERSLVAGSVFANENEVLSAGAVIEKDADLAVLPPVCGG